MKANSMMDAIVETKPSSGSARYSNDRYGIVVFSHLRWKFVWQRPQQFLSRFAAHHPVLFVELTDFDLKEGDSPYLELENVARNVTVANVHLPSKLAGSEDVNGLMRKFVWQAIDRVNTDGALDHPLLWYYSPMDAGWALGHIPGRAIVYDCMDELSQFKDAPPELLKREAKLLQSADIVFTGGYELWLKKSKVHGNVHFFGCGVEYDHFSQAQSPETEIPADVADLPKPIVGWFGVVDERMDYDLLRELAQRQPDWSFVIVGPVVKVDPSALPQGPNLHWLGGRDYKDLPSYCRAFDVCMMPFALNEATQFINPTKALEYLATSKPVVSTPVSDVVRQYPDAIHIAKTSEDFASCIHKALGQADQAMIARGVEKAKAASWESTVERMRELIHEAVESKPAASLY